MFIERTGRDFDHILALLCSASPRSSLTLVALIMYIEWVWVARSVMITNLECSQNRNAIIKNGLHYHMIMYVLGVEGTWCIYMYIIVLCILH